MSDYPFALTDLPTGTNWNCGVEADLKQIARTLRHYTNDLIRQGDWLSTSGKLLGFIAFLLAILNTMLTIEVIRILLPIFVGAVTFFAFGDNAITAYDTAGELQGITDGIRDELLLTVCERIDGNVFLRTVQMDRNNQLNDYRDATTY